MSKAIRIGIISGVLGAGAVAGVLGAGPAQANCLRGEVALHKSGQSDQILWPSSHCFHDTGEPDMLYVPADVTVTGIPTGHPNGARIGVWVPWAV